ncbi:MAG: RNA polymerase sigma-54 factor [Flammeovirgaceae bacterium]|nr:RNA polymerase sigma-54 factor [Flammeovirgaceae bacterium]
MQKLILSQSLQQKLSPQQIQFIKLLQVPTAELDARIEDELEINPALEEGDAPLSDDEPKDSFEEKEESDNSTGDYLHDDYTGYKMAGNESNSLNQEKEYPISIGTTLHEQLLTQLGFLKLNEHQHVLGKQLLGSIDSDGYLRRDLDAIVNDLAFSQGIETDKFELSKILKKIQTFEPAGIGAQSLQSCLMLQLERRDLEEDQNNLAYQLLKVCFNEFSKKHYEKIEQKLGISSAELKNAIGIITRLNPKPGGAGDEDGKIQFLMPDFILKNNNGSLELTLNAKNAPELRISRSYSEMFDTYHSSKKKDKKLRETVSFIKQKLDAARWFIDAIKQRQTTLLNTMQAIINIQSDYFQEGDETKLKPMILKDIAERIGMDISTVSRVASSKSIQTDFGIYPLKHFFSEGISTQSGEDVSSREVKNKLRTLIDEENKIKPLSDDKIEKLLKKEGYNIARRTVAKYREQLDIPVARLRKEL